MEEAETLYNRIAELRAARGLSPQQLADAIGVSRKTISTVEPVINALCRDGFANGPLF